MLDMLDMLAMLVPMQDSPLTKELMPLHLQLTLTLPLMPLPPLSTTLSTPTIMLVKFTPPPSPTFTKMSPLRHTSMSKLHLKPTSTLKSQLPPMCTLLPPTSTPLPHPLLMSTLLHLTSTKSLHLTSTKSLHQSNTQPLLKLPTPGTLLPTMQATPTKGTLMPTPDTPDTLTPSPLPSPPPHKSKT